MAKMSFSSFPASAQPGAPGQLGPGADTSHPSDGDVDWNDRRGGTFSFVPCERMLCRVIASRLPEADGIRYRFQQKRLEVRHDFCRGDFSDSQKIERTMSWK